MSTATQENNYDQFDMDAYYAEALEVSMREDELAQKKRKDEELMIKKAIDESLRQQEIEKMENEAAIHASIIASKKKKIENKEKSRPTKNANKIITYDLNTVNASDPIELNVSGVRYYVSINAEFVNNNIHNWIVKFDTGKLWGKMEWEIEFTDSFPNKPPKIRVIKPIFKPYTGHITIGGAICNPFLVSGQGWNNERDILTLIGILLSDMVDTKSPAKLNDGDERAQRYTKENAEAGRKRFLQTHGWTL